jgi:DNA uptake protein ComE-like DNA-binding protein
MSRFRFLIAALLLPAFPLFPMSAPPASAGPSRAPTTSFPQFLDINTATAEQLKALPGIGEADAENIINGRPYQREEELVQRKIIPWTVYEQIKGKIVVKQK